MTQSAIWIFGYGSLMWNPGFGFVSKQTATLSDYHRSFCMRSIHHRGTDESPGLVLALDAMSGATCDGLAFEVAGAMAAQVLEYLRARELISSAYLEAVLPITLRDGRQVQAVTYVIDADHVQYCGGLPLSEQAGIIATAIGGRGRNDEYLHNTASHLHELGISDDDLDWLSGRVSQLA
ncbi:gamma-glutamylcyclotransferase [Profundibacter sp.]